jgi:hypothetical protein
MKVRIKILEDHREGEEVEIEDDELIKQVEGILDNEEWLMKNIIRGGERLRE